MSPARRPRCASAGGLLTERIPILSQGSAAPPEQERRACIKENVTMKKILTIAILTGLRARFQHRDGAWGRQAQARWRGAGRERAVLRAGRPARRRGPLREDHGKPMATTASVAS